MKSESFFLREKASNFPEAALSNPLADHSFALTHRRNIQADCPRSTHNFGPGVNDGQKPPNFDIESNHRRQYRKSDLIRIFQEELIRSRLAQ
jgi:hypothetical protein